MDLYLLIYRGPWSNWRSWLCWAIISLSAVSSAAESCFIMHCREEDSMQMWSDCVKRRPRCIGVARNPGFYLGVHFFPPKRKSWRPSLVVALNTQAKTAKLTTSTLQIFPAWGWCTYNFFFFLLARQPNGDDEVEIRCLHSCLSRTMSIASFVFSCKRFKSSCILLIHFLHGGPLLRLPGI